MNKVMNLSYASSITDLHSINSSFASGLLRIAYHGLNRNKTSISKEVFERCIKTAYNCPIVCNYIRDDDALGGHDMSLVQTESGGYKLVNETQPVGCIPESANIFWETVIDDDGVEREYLCAEALLWKRQEAYEKIKTDGITNQSMEIAILDHEIIDGIMHIYDFEFTAFTLIGCEPCFESASLITFSSRDFKQQLSEMMLELKESFSMVNTQSRDDIHPQNNSTEGGEVLNEKLEMIAKYGLNIEALTFSIDEITLEELEEKLKSFSSDSEPTPAEPTPADNDDPAESNEPVENFALNSNFENELREAVRAEKLHLDWGDPSRYWMVDFDVELSEVYVHEYETGHLFGAPFTVDGDKVYVDFACKKRKKYTIVDFDEGSAASQNIAIFSLIKDNTDLEAKYLKASEEIETLKEEIATLREFKLDVENREAAAEREKVFAMFSDLDGVEAYEELKNTAENYSAEAIEEKCYAIRGRNVKASFSAIKENKATKLIVEHIDKPDKKEPYGGLFVEFGYEKE